MMEGAGVPVPIIQLLIGHSRKATMGTTAIYSKGERVNVRKTINKLHYSRAVMRLIAAEGQPRRSASQRQGSSAAVKRTPAAPSQHAETRSFGRIVLLRVVEDQHPIALAPLGRGRRTRGRPVLA